MAQKFKKNILMQERLERSVLHGLASEWETALWVLENEHRKGMRPPFFGLKDTETRLGSWCPERREISVNRSLALTHSWDAVREVLLHEMAHQLTDEVLHASQEPPHGPTFHRACYLLRANPKASGNVTPLDKRILEDPSNTENRLVARIKKLMALGQSRNQYEAESAMAKAQELMTKYHLAHITESPKNDFVSVFLGKPKLRHRREEYCLANLLQDFYYVYGIWVSAYVLEKRKMGRVLEVNGTLPNIQTASYVFDFVDRFVNAQWIQYNETGKLTYHRKTDFAIGIIEGFRSTLESKQHSNKSKKETALIKRGDKMLAEYASYRYPQTVRFKRSASQHHVEIYQDGITIGKNLTISKGIGKQESPKKIPYFTH